MPLVLLFWMVFILPVNPNIYYYDECEYWGDSEDEP